MSSGQQSRFQPTQGSQSQSVPLGAGSPVLTTSDTSIPVHESRGSGGYGSTDLTRSRSNTGAGDTAASPVSTTTYNTSTVGAGNPSNVGAGAGAGGGGTTFGTQQSQQMQQQQQYGPQNQQDVNISSAEAERRRWEYLNQRPLPSNTDVCSKVDTRGTSSTLSSGPMAKLKGRSKSVSNIGPIFGTPQGAFMACEGGYGRKEVVLSQNPLMGPVFHLATDWVEGESELADKPYGKPMPDAKDLLPGSVVAVAPLMNYTSPRRGQVSRQQQTSSQMVGGLEGQQQSYIQPVLQHISPLSTQQIQQLHPERTSDGRIQLDNGIILTEREYLQLRGQRSGGESGGQRDDRYGQYSMSGYQQQGYPGYGQFDDEFYGRGPQSYGRGGIGQQYGSPFTGGGGYGQQRSYGSDQRYDQRGYGNQRDIGQRDYGRRDYDRGDFERGGGGQRGYGQRDGSSNYRTEYRSYDRDRSDGEDRYGRYEDRSRFRKSPQIYDDYDDTGDQGNWRERYDRREQRDRYGRGGDDRDERRGDRYRDSGRDKMDYRGGERKDSYRDRDDDQDWQQTQYQQRWPQRQIEDRSSPSHFQQSDYESKGRSNSPIQSRSNRGIDRGQDHESENRPANWRQIHDRSQGTTDEDTSDNRTKQSSSPLNWRQKHDMNRGNR